MFQNSLIALLLLSVLALSQAESPRVFAHYMMCNTEPSDASVFEYDIKKALSGGIDAFALNMGLEDFIPDRVALMHETAKQFPNFKLFFSFDMTVMGGMDILVTYIKQYHDHPSGFTYNGKYFVSTFAGQVCPDGTTGSMNDCWQHFLKDPLTADGIEIFFVPNFFVEASGLFETNPVLDGIFNWICWPDGDMNETIWEDKAYADAANKNNKVFMAGASPWFFTHFGPPLMKNWIYKSELQWPLRWELILELKPQLVEIITWNDYGESHYVGPIAGALPFNSGDWVNGYDHQPWVDMAAYYITAYKTGSKPAITSDQVYFWYRTHSKSATRTNDPLGPPNNADWADDDIIVFALLTSDAQIEVTTGGSTFTLQAQKGQNLLAQPFGQGNVTVSLKRNGQTIATKQGDRIIQDEGELYNFNPCVGKLDIGTTGNFLESSI